MTKELHFDESAVSLQIWDTAGQEKHRSMQAVFYKGSDGCLIVFDLTNPATFREIARWKEDLLTSSGVPNPTEFPFILLGNKADLEGERKVSIAADE
jgi:small GTP-binding protein